MKYDPEKATLRIQLCQQLIALREKFQKEEAHLEQQLENANKSLAESLSSELTDDEDLVPFISGIGGGEKIEFIPGFECDPRFCSLLVLQNKSDKIGFLIYEQHGTYQIRLGISKGFEEILKTHPRYSSSTGLLHFGIACTCCAFPDHKDLGDLLRKHGITTLVVRKADALTLEGITVSEIANYSVPEKLKRTILKIKHVN